MRAVPVVGLRTKWWLLLVAALGADLACSPTQVVLPSRDLDRPTDMTFACVGIFTDADGKVTTISGQPMGKCHPWQAEDVRPSRPGTINPNAADFRTYAFVSNANRGDLSVIDMSYCRPDDSACQPPGAGLVDLDPGSVGYGAAPLGELPEAISASQDGCRVVSANRGSCDLTLVDSGALLTSHLDVRRDLPAEPDPRQVTTIVPVMASGRLAVAPGEIAFVPQQTGLLGGVTDVCGPTMAPGTLAPPVGDAAPAPGERVPWRVVVTFPSCDLVALIELPSGTILDSYQMIPGDQPFVHTGRNPVCQATDCPHVPDTRPDGGAGDAEPGDDANPQSDTGAAAAVPPRLGTLGILALAMHPEGSRIYFGGTNTPSVFVLDIAGQSFVEPTVPPAGSTTPSNSVASLSGAEGTVRLRLSVDPYAYSKAHDAADTTLPEYGRFVAGRHDEQPSDPLEFLYVIAKDSSLRVMDVADRQNAPVECDLGIDPTDPAAMASALDPDNQAPRKACFVYNSKGGPRRLLSAGIPGLRFASPPQDIAFANYRTPPTNTPATPTVDEQLMSGAFAFVMTNAGAVYVLNIDPEPRLTSQVWRDTTVDPPVLHYATTDPATRLGELPRPLTHSMRDFNVLTYSSSLQGSQVGAPRIETAPTMPTQGPYLKSFTPTESRIDARLVPYTNTPPVLETYAYFPNRATAHAQTWRIDWEGDLTGVRIGGDIVGGDSLVTTIADNGSGFCGLGGSDGDVMTLVGCDTDAGCPVSSVCVHSDQVTPSVDGRAIQGMCLPRSMTDYKQCDRMLETFRRYEIVGPGTDSLGSLKTNVVPRRAEVPRPAYTNQMGQRVTCDPLNKNAGKFLDCSTPVTPIYDKFEYMQVTSRPDGSLLRERAVRADGSVREADLEWRCFQPCASDQECREGRTCVPFPGLVLPPDKTGVCAEAAPIVEGCGLDQLFSYKLSAGGAFVVSGSTSGRPESYRLEATDQGPVCVRDPTVPTLVSRIPMNTPACPDTSAPARDAKGQLIWDDTFLGRDSGPSPDPCLVLEPGATPTASPVVSAVFENTELRLVLTGLEQQFADALEIQFTVYGGFSPQLVTASADATPGVPARLLLGPVPAFPYSTVCPDGPATGVCAGPGPFSDLPYLFLVDQRQYSNGRLGPRGQVLRIIPRISTTQPYAGFESFALGGSYFPIQ